MSTVITVRIPEEMKKEMKRFKNVNWSQVVREAIARKIREEKIKYALKVMENISSKAKLEKPAWKIIRESRDTL
ncbi:MAG: hypothetical protein J7L38_02910 [Thermoproteales archaeon]|nr:hypothetical protein [Thermoproteales archaeon]RLE66747.1 MAG: hypothetical protein DRJ47_01905 [Thermoprotei archaeon]